MRDDIVRKPIWLDVELPRFPALAADADVDVVVVGGGLTGLMTAWLLAREGRSVMLIERDRLACANTARSTAHLTCVTDLPLHEATERYGDDVAKAFWDAGTTGIDLIARTVSELQVDCDFRWTPGYLHVAPDRDRDAANLRRDAQLAASYGLDALFLVSVPGVGRPGVRFGRQALFHPLCFAAGLVANLTAIGGIVHEGSTLEALEGSPPRLRINGHTVRCRQVVIASQAPLFDRGLALPGAAGVRERLALYTSFVIAGTMPTGTHPAALYWDTADPYEYLRVENSVGGQTVLLGGRDVPAGESVDESLRFSALEKRLAQRLPEARATHCWSGELVQSEDGLPFIGPLGDGVFVATGFCGNGFTLGAVAALMVRDACLDRVHPWEELFDPQRPRWRGSLWQTLSKTFERLSGHTDGGPAPGDRPASL